MTRLAGMVLVVRSLDRAVTIYERALGFERHEDPVDVPSLGARQVVLRAENCILEVLEPYDETKPPGMFLAARGEGLFSLALEVDEPSQAREELGRAFVDARGRADDPSSWWVRPADAHGLLLQVAGKLS
jgi:catechol 2,3-dioxygenase-like lactoylglutathione lyase family enzyme